MWIKNPPVPLPMLSLYLCASVFLSLYLCMFLLSRRRKTNYSFYKYFLSVTSSHTTSSLNVVHTLFLQYCSPFSFHSFPFFSFFSSCLVHIFVYSSSLLITLLLIQASSLGTYLDLTPRHSGPSALKKFNYQCHHILIICFIKYGRIVPAQSLFFLNW